MTYYRFYSLGGHGKIEAAEWVQASTDEDAIMLARARRPSLDCELWDHGRLVARMPRRGPVAFFVPRTSREEALGTVSYVLPFSRP